MDRYVIPAKLDEPERIGLWTVDEFIVMCGPFTAGILTQHPLYGVACAFVGWWVLRKAKAGRAGSWLLHAAYWHLPAEVSGVHSVPPSYLRLMAG